MVGDGGYNDLPNETAAILPIWVRPGPGVREGRDETSPSEAHLPDELRT